MAGSLMKDAVADARIRMTELVQRNRTSAVVITALFVALAGLGLATIGRDSHSGETTLRADQVAIGAHAVQSDGGGSGPEKQDLSQGVSNRAPLAHTSTTYVNSYGGINSNVVNPRKGSFTAAPSDAGGDTSATTTKAGTGSASGSGSESAGGSDSGSNPGSGSGTGTGSGSTGGGTNPGNTVGLSVPPSAFDANRVAYVSGGGTWTINPDGTDPQKVTGNAYFPAWSRAHNSLAVAGSDGVGGALSILTLSSRRTITQSPASIRDGDSAPSWSPDGSKIVFARSNDSQRIGSIWTVNADGTGEKRIASGGCYNEDPTWSPDGSKIVFWSSRDHCTASDPSPGSYELYVMNADGSFVHSLGTATNSRSPSFSPDGQWIAFASDRDGSNGFDIYTMRLDGSIVRRLTAAAGDDTDPTWSPDGSRIAFRSARSGGAIYTMKADGSDETFLVAGFQPAWS